MPEPSRAPGAPAIIRLAEVDSTNAEAHRRAAAGERGPLWITSGHQTAGRGRSGRYWASARGCLAATLLFRPVVPIARLHELSLVAGIAAHTAIVTALPAGGSRDAVRLKWPNDVLIAGDKVAGILVECSTFGADVLAMVGVGVNVQAPPDLSDRRATSLGEHGSDITSDAFAVELAGAADRWLAVWRSGAGFGAIRAAWLERAGPEGEPMMVNAGDGPVRGAFAGLDTDGALLLLDADGRRRRFSFGDVTLGATQA